MTTRPFSRLRGILHFFGTGVLDQIMLSGANFLAGFAMIRFTTDVAYGQLVLAQSTILLLVAAQGAWLSGPVNALAPSKSPEAKRLMVGSLAASQTRVLRFAAPVLLLIPIGGYLLGIWAPLTAAAIGATVLASWFALEREFMRSALLVYSRPGSILRADVVYVAVWMFGVALAAWNVRAAGLWAVGALTAAGWAGAVMARRMLAADPGLVAQDAKPYWREIRPLGLWSAVGAIIYWLFGQSYNYILAARLDLKAVVDVNAARLALMPVFVFTLGINNLLLPVAARWLAELKLARMLGRLGVLMVVVLCVDAVYFAVGWRLRHWLVVDLMHKTIADQDRLLILWACIAVIFLVREVLQAALWALRRLKSMVWLIAVSAAVSLLLMWEGTAWWGTAAVLIGQVAGECVNLVGLVFLLWRQLVQARK